jgi:dihydroorotase
MIDMRSEQNPADMQPKAAAAIAEEYPDLIVGIKAAHYWPGPKPFDSEHPPWASVDKAVEAAALSGTRAMIDFQPNLPLSPYPDMILKHLRPGDIHTHVFAQQFPIVDENGTVLEHMHEARRRGVYFDVGHGAGSFWFRNGLRALRGGFPPDTLSTDLHASSIRGPALSMLHVMSKFLNMGMPIEEVVARSTCLPAKLIARPELGALSVGGCADIAVIRKLTGAFNYIDNGYARLTGDSMLDCQMTIRAGKIVYDIYGLSMPEWTDAPESYWTPPYRG